MSKRTIAADQNVDLTERDIPGFHRADGRIIYTQLELRIGDWLYEDCHRTRDGVESLIEAIDELNASLDTVRAALFDIWTSGEGP